ncbi:polyprenyl diphosphate synthase [Streptomyces tendae]|uniref:polyprenyl diphosphate synthase n=1 Tax=Streptomyces tendae TaxID=1932 RepID=UPI0036978CC7
MSAQPLRLRTAASDSMDDRPAREHQVPRHVAVILDGNRRWAAAHGQPLRKAYRRGGKRVGRLLEWCDEAGVRYLTVWALSPDNFRRHPEEVTAVVDAVTAGLVAIAAGRRWPIRLIGDLEQLPAHHTARLRAIERETAEAEGTTLNVALAYSGRHDIVQAVRAMMRHRTDTGADSTVPTEHLLSQHLSTAGQPDPELVIRTSGEQRLSGFMPWQTAHAELYFTEVPWPAFDKNDFDVALHWYAHRQRRHGK